jgi:hypothetical protein
MAVRRSSSREPNHSPSYTFIFQEFSSRPFAPYRITSPVLLSKLLSISTTLDSPWMPCALWRRRPFHPLPSSPITSLKDGSKREEPPKLPSPIAHNLFPEDPNRPGVHGWQDPHSDAHEGV